MKTTYDHSSFYLTAGRLKTPAPTILLIKLKTSLGMIAVPPLSPPLGSSAAATSEVSLVVETTEGLVAKVACRRVGVTRPVDAWQDNKSNTAMDRGPRSGKQSVKDADQQQKTRGDGKGDSSGGVAGVVVVVVNKMRRRVSCCY
jgi:hypothetical protein